MSADSWAIVIAILGDLIAFAIVLAGAWWTKPGRKKRNAVDPVPPLRRRYR